jgi:rubrerythrin
MKPMTEQNLKDAFCGESKAHMKYLAFADKAEKEGKPNLAKLFTAIAYAESVHAINHLKALDGLQESLANLDVAWGGEDFEIESMYPAYKVVAELEEEKKAIKSFNWALEAEKDHRDFYAQAKEAVKAGNDANVSNVYVCEVCGHTHVGDSAPEKCPICGVGSDKYRKF